MNLETVIQHYTTALIWSEEWEDKDLSERAKAKIREFCTKFLSDAESVLDATEYNEEQTGHDLYFTQTGQGVGFWEADHCNEEQGERLTKLAKSLGSCDFYPNDDNEIDI